MSESTRPELEAAETAVIRAADRALHCARLRIEADRLNTTHFGDAYANYLAAQLRDYAYLLEVAEREGWFSHRPEATT
jgi:hypothetical protein